MSRSVTALSAVTPSPPPGRTLATLNMRLSGSGFMPGLAPRETALTTYDGTIVHAQGLTTVWDLSSKPAFSLGNFLCAFVCMLRGVWGTLTSTIYLVTANCPVASSN